MRNTEWIESLKVGDEVVVICRDSHSIESVTEITNTQIVTTYGIFEKDTGVSVSKKIFSESYIRPSTDELKQIINKTILVSKLSNFNYRNLSIDQLERIKSIIDEGKK